MANTVSGGIIDIEAGSEVNTDTGSYEVIGKTRGTVSWGPNVEVAESSDDHSSKHADKAAVGEAHEISFEGKVLSTLGGLETGGHYDTTDEEVKGSVDIVPEDEESRRITVYEDEEAKAEEEYLVRIETQDVLSILENLDLEPDGFSTWECTLHSRESPTVQISN